MDFAKDYFSGGWGWIAAVDCCRFAMIEPGAVASENSIFDPSFDSPRALLMLPGFGVLVCTRARLILRIVTISPVIVRSKLCMILGLRA